MSASNGFALLFTVAMLAVTIYFLLGSVPLLLLKHDTPTDARFIRSFYVIYYRMAILAAFCAAIAHGSASRPAFAAGAAMLAILNLVLHARILPRMQALRDPIRAADPGAILTFRQIHKSAIGLNFAQLITILGSLAAF